MIGRSIIYEEEKVRILSAVGHKIVAIEHVGSTAVPGLGAKPIIDIMAGVSRLSDDRSILVSLLANQLASVTTHKETVQRAMTYLF